MTRSQLFRLHSASSVPSSLRLFLPIFFLLLFHRRWEFVVVVKWSFQLNFCLPSIYFWNSTSEQSDERKKHSQRWNFFNTFPFCCSGILRTYGTKAANVHSWFLFAVRTRLKLLTCRMNFSICVLVVLSESCSALCGIVIVVSLPLLINC